VIPIRYLTLFAAIVLLTGCIALGAHLFSSGEEYSRFNTEWNGTSAFFSSVAGVPEIREGSELETIPCRTLLILAPPPDMIADASYRSYLSRGNRILLVDDEGYGNSFLADLQSSLRIVPGNLSSVDAPYNTPAIVHAYPAGDHPLFERVDDLTLNMPASVSGGNSLAETSLLSWMDNNGNGHPDNGEVLHRFIVMAQETVGGGEVLVIADVSLFTNGMIGENPQFLENIRSTPGLCIDQRESRTATAELLPSLLSWIKGSYITKIVIVSIVMLFGILVWERKYG
jgi:hypothetical protein